jgi:c-di-GMP-related signal transduction protein
MKKLLDKLHFEEVTKSSNIVYIAESGKEYTKEDIYLIAKEAFDDLSEEDKKTIINTQGSYHKTIEMLSDQLLETADWQHIETLADELKREPKIHFPELEL